MIKMMMVIMMIKELMTTSTIMVSYLDDKRFTYGIKKPWNDEDLAKRPGPTAGRTDRHTGL